jgi:N-glycosylase/DNA lyase
MKSAISVSNGIRILKQPAWECLISFIISQNNNIPRIKKIIESLCKLYGNEINFDNKTYYSFPSPEQLYKADLALIKAGFRAKYIQDATNKVVEGEIDLSTIYSKDKSEAQEYLKKIKGVGEKVADCVLLFAYQRFDVFPKDVWIKKIITKLYNISDSEIELFATNKFKNLAGIAQQYLFYQARNVLKI